MGPRKASLAQPNSITGDHRDRGTSRKKKAFDKYYPFIVKPSGPGSCRSQPIFIFGFSTTVLVSIIKSRCDMFRCA